MPDTLYTEAAHKESLDDALLAEYETRLAALRFEATGFIEALFVSPRPDAHLAVPCLHILPESGVEGQYPGKQWWQGRRVPGRQISALNAEVLEALEIPYAVPGDNLAVRGLNLALFQTGDILRIGDALLRVTPTLHRPCAKLAARTTLTKKTAIAQGKRRGLLLNALRPATICLGNSVERLLFPAEDS